MLKICKPNWNIISKIKFNKCKEGNIYQKLNLNNIGVDLNKFNLLRLSYNNLPIDKDYPFKNDKPTRFRRYSNFNLDVVDCDTLVFNQINQNMFNQDVDDFRNKTRAFTTMEKTVINDTFYQLMGQIVGLTLFSNPSIKKMNILIV